MAQMDSTMEWAEQIRLSQGQIGITAFPIGTMATQIGTAEQIIGMARIGAMATPIAIGIGGIVNSNHNENET
jgi:hypothetical protein